MRLKGGNIFVAVAAGLGVGLFSASVLAQDYSGWWWNESESGRGVNIGQDGDSLGGAIFLYDEQGDPLWATFTGTLENDAATGPLFTFTGSPMGMPYDPDDLETTQIGTVTIVFDGSNGATISYDAGDFTGPTEITRFPVGPLPIEGRFKTILEWVEFCDPGEIGATEEYVATVETEGSDISISLVEELPSESTLCSLAGGYTQIGNRILAEGSISCATTADGVVIEEVEGNWATDDLAVTNEWLHANIDIDFELEGIGLCQGVARMSGFRSDL